MRKTVLITGGAGYIGSITARRIEADGFVPVLFDSLPFCRWNRTLRSMICVHGDIRNTKDLYNVFTLYHPTAVMHLAALTSVVESMDHPYEYYQNNLIGGLTLLESMRQFDCRYMIFSSTSAVFGNTTTRTSENTPQNPVSVYGAMKKNFEEMLYFWDKLYGIKHSILRYFNASGASLGGDLGEGKSASSKLIPSLLRVYYKKQKTLTIYGKNYPTKDGTAERDYVYIEDLAIAHVLALKHLIKTNKSDSFNLGSGKTHTNLEVVRKLEAITKITIPIRYGHPRQGEVGVLSTDIRKAQKVLGWEPKLSDLRTILETATKWYAKSLSTTHDNN